MRGVRIMQQFTGETVEQAIEKGLTALKIARSDADIQVVEEGKKGFLGLGKREAVVSITPQNKPEPVVSMEEAIVEDVVDVGEPSVRVNTSENSEPTKLSDEEAITALAVFLTDMTRDMGIPAMVKLERTPNRVVYHLETSKKGALIGKHGAVLNAIQYIAQVYIHRIAKNRIAIMVNVGDYRERRESIINRLSYQAVRQVKETGQPVFLEPMPAFERKQVHHIISQEDDITTHSEGNEPHRYLVVELK